MFGSAEHFPVHPVVLHQLFDFFHDLIDEIFAFGQPFANVVKQIFVRFGVEIFQAQIFQFALDLRNTQSTRQRRVNIQRFARHTLLAFVRKEIERTHIVQTVGKFDDNHPHVLCHCHENFTEVFRFFRFFRFKFDFFEFGYATYKRQHFFPKFPFNIFRRRRSVFNDVVQKRRRYRRFVQS